MGILIHHEGTKSTKFGILIIRNLCVFRAFVVIHSIRYCLGNLT